jgi:hypothetical protein
MYKWLRSHTIGRLNSSEPTVEEHHDNHVGMSAWKERQDAEGAVGRYLSDLPCTSRTNDRESKLTIQDSYCNVCARPSGKW